MRYLLLLIWAVTLPWAGFSQTKSINQFYKQYKKGEEATSISLPGIVIKLGVAIAKGQVEDEEDRQALKLAKKVKKIRLLVLEEANPIASKDFQKLLKGVKKEQFEELITVRSEGTYVNLLIRERKEKLKNILVLVNEPDSFVLVSLKSKLKLEQITDLINQAMKGEVKEIKLAGNETDVPKA